VVSQSAGLYPSVTAPSDMSHKELSFPQVDYSEAATWVFPDSSDRCDDGSSSSRYAVRDYQVSISKQALFVNTLVCLPTGLGKTLIASVVMYNYYRWFPLGIYEYCIIYRIVFACKKTKQMLH